MSFPRVSLLSLAAATLTVGMGLTACSSSSSSTSSSPPPSSPASTPSTPSVEPTTGAAAISAIKTNWTAFFNFKSSVSRHIALLQNGSTFAPAIRGLVGSPLAAAATAKVTSVKLTTASQAAVTYTILVGGKTGLANQQGIAVYDGGVWKVGDVSFCGLLLLENGGKKAGLFPACKALVG
jgi:hypothetical protein